MENDFYLKNNNSATFGLEYISCKSLLKIWYKNEKMVKYFFKLKIKNSVNKFKIDKYQWSMISGKKVCKTI